MDTSAVTMPKKSSKPKKPEELHQVLVRMQYGTFEELEKDAARNFRTVNMHILWLVEERLKKVRDDPSPGN